MTAHDPALLRSGLLRTEGNFHIPAGELPISRQQDPGNKTEPVPKGKNEAQRERGDQRQRRAVAEVNAIIDHAKRPARTGNVCDCSVILPASRRNHYNVTTCNGALFKPRDRTSRGLLRASSRLPVCSWSAARRRNLSSNAGRKESTLSVARAFASLKPWARTAQAHLTSPSGSIRQRAPRPKTCRPSTACPRLLPILSWFQRPALTQQSVVRRWSLISARAAFFQTTIAISATWSRLHSS